MSASPACDATDTKACIYARPAAKGKYDVCKLLGLRSNGRGHSVQVHFRGTTLADKEWVAASELKRRWDELAVITFIEEKETEQRRLTEQKRAAADEAEDRELRQLFANAAAAQPKFKVGDRIAAFEYTDPCTGVVHIVDMKIRQYTIQFSDKEKPEQFPFEHIDENANLAPLAAAAVSPPKFKVGDRIIVTDEDGDVCKGVVQLVDVGLGKYTIQFSGDAARTRLPFEYVHREAKLEPIAAASVQPSVPKFKAGDRISLGPSEFGDLGVVTTVDMEKERYGIKWDDGNVFTQSFSFIDGECKLVPLAAAAASGPPEPKFKVGDCIVLTDSDVNGKVISTENGMYMIEWEDGSGGAHPFKFIERRCRLAEPVTPKFKAGDHLLWMNQGDKGMVISVNTSQRTYTVNWASRGGQTINSFAFIHGECKLAPPAAAGVRPSAPKFKVGDRIVDLDQDDVSGTIVSAHADNYTVMWSDENVGEHPFEFIDRQCKLQTVASSAAAAASAEEEPPSKRARLEPPPPANVAWPPGLEESPFADFFKWQYMQRMKAHSAQ